MPEREEALKSKLEEQFDYLKDKITVQRERRLWADVPREQLIAVAQYARDELGFGSLCTITALDSGENWEMIYHMAAGGVMLNLKVLAPKTDPVYDTITGLYEGASMYELEAMNLLGLSVRGMPTDIRYPLPDDWPAGEYPLRKDWVQAKAGE